MANGAGAWNTVLDWLIGIVEAGGDVIQWLTTPIDGLATVLGDYVSTPLALIGVGGLLLVIAYAIVKWVIPV